MTKATKKPLLERMRDGEELSLSLQTAMIFELSVPAILAQLSSLIMQYIDASMVGRIGGNASASIGLISSSTWLFGGLSIAAATGFTVQIAKKIGAKDEKGARNLVREGLVCVLLFAAVLTAVGASISSKLPLWLHGGEELAKDASVYFLVFALSLPFVVLNYAAAGMLQCSGNMKVPGILEIIMCALDVIFNALLIFPARKLSVLGRTFTLPGADLGVTGAALGTALAQAVTVVLLLYFLLVRSKELHLRRGEKLRWVKKDIREAIRIGVPVAVEQTITCGAYIAFTRIVSPLGALALAANSFAITAESLCYMPGYGIGASATTIVGQCIGAKRSRLARRLGFMTTLVGILVMTVTGGLMFMFSPFMMSLLTPDKAIRTLGAHILRIEAFAEPMYGASIVAAGVFRGAGDTAVSSVLNFISMWTVRIPLAAILAPVYGLSGIWTAMCIELCVRGILFLVLLSIRSRKWNYEQEQGD